MTLAAFHQFLGAGQLLIWAIDPPPLLRQWHRKPATASYPRRIWFEAVVEIENIHDGGGIFPRGRPLQLTDREGPEAAAAGIYQPKPAQAATQ